MKQAILAIPATITIGLGAAPPARFMFRIRPVP